MKVKDGLINRTPGGRRRNMAYEMKYKECVLLCRGVHQYYLSSGVDAIASRTMDAVDLLIMLGSI
jgi:hypothetical protein